MAYPAPTKGFSRPIPEAAMLPRQSAETHPPPPVLSLSAGAEPKSQGHCRKSDITDESPMPDISGYIHERVKVSYQLVSALHNQGR